MFRARTTATTALNPTSANPPAKVRYEISRPNDDPALYTNRQIRLHLQAPRRRPALAGRR